MQVTAAPTIDSPLFQVLVTFSEPITWLANTTTAATTTAANASALDAQAAADAAADGATSVSRMVLTNAALLNISMAGPAAALADGGVLTGAASSYRMWLRSWGGAGAGVRVLGAAYQDLGGNRGTRETSLQVVVPGSELLSRAGAVASAATAVSATASALSAAAAVAAAGGAGGAGGSTSLLRSIGHTQFLAMSVSLAVPWLPSEYLQLCAGLE
jgi:hypothetical protein